LPEDKQKGRCTISAYIQGKTSIRDPECLVEALKELGWSSEQIEVHHDAVTLYDYKGKARPEQAEVVIRRKHISGASNDMGFARQADGTFNTIVSQYDRRFLATRRGAELGADFATRVSTLATVIAAEKQMRLKGLFPQRLVEGTKITITGTRKF